VVVTYRSRSTVGATLEAARRAHRAGNLECVVVDNASGDGTAEWVRAEHSWVRLVESPHNRGFARGCNLGLGEVRTRYALLLNPDAVLEPPALARLVRFLDERPRAGMAAPAIHEPGGALQEAGGLPTPLGLVLSALGGPSHHGRRPILPGEAPFPTDWLCGAVLLVRRSLLTQLGGFDPRFFLYFEETDLCRRALARGWELWAVGEAVATHLTGSSAAATRLLMYDGCIAEHYFRSRYYYLVKHHGWLAATTAELAELLALAASDLAHLVRRERTAGLATRMLCPILSSPARES
jgi:hypothetical protein